MSADITRLLATDPLADAERITGQSYKDDKPTMALGFVMHMDHAKVKEAALRETRDSWFGMDLADTLALYADLGFTEVLCDEFTGKSWGDEPAPAETFHILWHPDGILATVESYQGDRRNASKVYYNVRFHDAEDRWSYTSSGSYHRESYDLGERVWVGDHDAREGVRNTIERFREVGEFLPVWVERPFLWLITYSEDSERYRELTESRIARLPVDIRDAIGGEPR